MKVNHSLVCHWFLARGSLCSEVLLPAIIGSDAVEALDLELEVSNSLMLITEDRDAVSRVRVSDVFLHDFPRLDKATSGSASHMEGARACLVVTLDAASFHLLATATLDVGEPFLLDGSSNLDFVVISEPQVGHPVDANYMSPQFILLLVAN